MPQIGKYTLDDIDKPGQQTNTISQTPSEVIQAATPKPIVDVAKTIGENLPSRSTVLSTITGGLAGPYAAPVAALTDLLQDPELQKRSVGENLGILAKGSLFNEAFGRLFSGAGKIASEIIKPGSVGSEGMNELIPFKPTFSQLTGSRVAKLVENTFSAKDKENALQVSGNIIKDQGEAYIQDQVGDPDITLATPVKQALNIKQDLESTFDSSKLESNKRGAAATFISKANRKNIPIYALDPLTQQVYQNGTRDVIGGITPTRYLQSASDLLKRINASDAPPDPNGPLVKTLNNIINKSKELDANGNIIPRERDFADMWAQKQYIDDIAYNNPKSKPDFTDDRFKELSKAINQDMTDSISKWPNSGPLALNLWQEAKTIAQKRNQLFLGSPIEKSINELNSPINSINKIIEDPTVLKKAIISGKLQIPDQGAFKYITNNTRKDLAGYEITNLLNSARQQNGTFDGGKLMQMLTDPDKQESYRMLFGSVKNPQSQRAYLETFFKNINKVQDTDPQGMTRYWALKLTANGLGLAGGLLTGVTSSLPGGGAIIGGTLGLSALGKLMTNTTVAPIMAKLASGEGLGMPIQIAGRMMAEVLRNTPMQLYDKDGNTIDGKINKDGKFEVNVGQ